MALEAETLHQQMSTPESFSAFNTDSGITAPYAVGMDGEAAVFPDLSRGFVTLYNFLNIQTLSGRVTLNHNAIDWKIQLPDITAPNSRVDFFSDRGNNANTYIIVLQIEQSTLYWQISEDLLTTLIYSVDTPECFREITGPATPGLNISLPAELLRALCQAGIGHCKHQLFRDSPLTIKILDVIDLHKSTKDMTKIQWVPLFDLVIEKQRWRMVSTLILPLNDVPADALLNSEPSTQQLERSGDQGFDCQDKLADSISKGYENVHRLIKDLINGKSRGPKQGQPDPHQFDVYPDIIASLPHRFSIILPAPTIRREAVRHLALGDLILLGAPGHDRSPVHYLNIGPQLRFKLKQRGLAYEVIGQAEHYISAAPSSEMQENKDHSLNKEKQQEMNMNSTIAASSGEPTGEITTAADAPASDTADITTQDGNTADGDNRIQAAIDTLPVALTFEVGELTLTAQDLARVKPGFIFDLNRAPGAPVTLKANGAAIGRCDFVRIEEQLAARIVELFPAHASQSGLD